MELGKRLAKISKEAKERKARQRESEREQLERSEKNEAEEINRIVDFRYIVGGVTIVAALGGLYYAYKSDKRFERSESDKNVSESIIVPKQQAGYEITKCNRSEVQPSTTQTASLSCIENL